MTKLIKVSKNRTYLVQKNIMVEFGEVTNIQYTQEIIKPTR